MTLEHSRELVINYFCKFNNKVLDNESKNKIMASFGTVLFTKKGDIFIKEGSKKHRLAFLVSGNAISYKTIDNEKTIVKLFIAPDFVNAQTYLSELPSDISISFTSDSYILLSDYNIKQTNELLDEVPWLQQASYKLYAEEINQNLTIKSILGIKNSTKKIKKFRELFPKHFNDFSQTDIANFLGVSRETFGRLRFAD